MAEAPPRLREQQFALTRHLRDPDAPAPPGIEDRRLAIYRDLLFNNIRGLLASNFPVIARTLGTDRWNILVRAFYRDHRSRTPLFPEIGREFLRYLETAAAEVPAFLPELAHYEWAELALQISEATVADAGAEPLDGVDPRAALLERVPVLSPLAWPLAYRWPVHTLGPDHQPQAPPDAPTLLLLRREPDGRVRFSLLSPLAWRLLERLEHSPHESGRAQLLALAGEADASDPGPFLEGGAALLQQMAATGVIAGTRTPHPP